MCESKGQGARSGCVISGLGSSSASMVLRECGQPDGGERGGSGQGVAAASYLFRGGAAKARRCSWGGGEGAWASCPAPREMEGGGGAAEAEDRLVGTGWVGWFSRSAAHHQPKLHLLDEWMGRLFYFYIF